MSIKTRNHCFIPESPSTLPVRVTLTFTLSSVLPNPNPPVDKPPHFLLRFHVFSLQTSLFAETLLMFRLNFDQPSSQMQMCRVLSRRSHRNINHGRYPYILTTYISLPAQPGTLYRVLFIIRMLYGAWAIIFPSTAPQTSNKIMSVMPKSSCFQCGVSICAQTIMTHGNYWNPD